MGKHINRGSSPEPGKPGYCNPPTEHQFPKGKSGNPKGRPKGTNGVKTDLKKVAATIRSREINGKKVEGTTQFMALEMLGYRAAAGDLKAAALFIPLMQQILGIEDRDIDANRLAPVDQGVLERLLGRRLDEDELPLTEKAARKPGAPRAPRKARPAKTQGKGQSDGEI